MVNLKDILNPLYFEAGAGLYDSQVFEFGLCQLLLSLTVQGLIEFDVDMAINIADDRKKKTIGQVLTLIKKQVEFSSGWEATLIEAINARNALIHRFLVNNSTRMIVETEREALVRDIRNLRMQIQAGDKIVRNILMALYGRVGLDLDNLAKLAASELGFKEDLPSSVH